MRGLLALCLVLLALGVWCGCARDAGSEVRVRGVWDVWGEFGTK